MKVKVLTSLLGVLIPLVVYWKFHAFGWITVLAYTLFGYLLLALSLVDWFTFTVPDLLSVGGTLLGLVFSFFRKDITPLESFLASLTGFGLVVVLIFAYYKLKGVVCEKQKLTIRNSFCSLSILGSLYRYFL